MSVAGGGAGRCPSLMWWGGGRCPGLISGEMGGHNLPCHLSHDACEVPTPSLVDRQTPVKASPFHNFVCGR